MKLTIMTQVTVDGVMQGNGAALDVQVYRPAGRQQYAPASA